MGNENSTSCRCTSDHQQFEESNMTPEKIVEERRRPQGVEHKQKVEEFVITPKKAHAGGEISTSLDTKASSFR